VKDRKIDVINLKDEELKELLGNLKNELFNLKLQISLGQLANTSKKGSVRKDIARLLTEKKRREVGKGVQDFAKKD